MGRHARQSARVMMICPPYPSHRQAFAALAEELRARGHHVRYLCGDRLRSAPSTGAQDVSGHGHGLRRDILAGAARTDALCRSGLAAIAGYRPDLILGDQTEPAAGLLSRRSGVAMISVACGLPFDPEPGIPIPFLGWAPDASARGIRRLKTAHRISRWVLGPQARVIAAHARAWNLGPRRDFPDCVSPLMTLAQTAPGFDYPRPVGGDHVRHLGLFRAPAIEPFPDDIHPDPGRPFVYVSLGTLQGHRLGLLSRIARACRRHGAQVLVSHSGGLSADQAGRIPADWVRDFVPQRAILKRARLCVTHAGMNTAMECLEQGVPMLAMPLTNDQPGVAARIAACGAGLRMSAALATEGQLSAGLGRLLADPAFAARSARFAREARQWPRATGAADIIETFLPQTRDHPVTAALPAPGLCLG